MYFISYNDESNKFVLYVKGYNAIRGLDGMDPNTVVSATGSSQNPSVRFFSNEPGLVNIDFGDGHKEQYSFEQASDNTYRFCYKGFYQNNPKPNQKWFTKKDGSTYQAKGPYIYKDMDESAERSIKFEFTNPIYRVETSRVYITEFPTIDVPKCEQLIISSLRGESASMGIPVDRIGRMDSLTLLNITSDRNIIKGFPEAFTVFKNLKTLRVERVFDFSDESTAHLEKIAELSKLEKLTLQATYLKQYPKEWNSLENLTVLDITPNASDPDRDYIQEENPRFDNVARINSHLTNIAFIGSWYSYNDTSWHDYISGKGLENLTTFSSADNLVPLDELPEYFKEMRSLKNFSLPWGVLNSQTKADTFVESFYKYITEWEQTTMSELSPDGLRNQFYKLSVSLYSGQFPNSNRPSGILQAPSGFIKGNQNGSPTTPMEMIYVLTENYGQVWNVRPASATSRSAHPFEMVFVDGRAIIGDGDLITSFPKEFCYSKEEAVSLCKDHGVDEKPVIDWFENRGAGIPED